MLVASGQAPANRIDTVSFYQEGEPAWDERPYIEVIERARGRVGCHIDVSGHTLIRYDYDPDRPELTPVSRGEQVEPAQKLSRYIASHGHRVVLSGVAGDELLGGAPSFIPQLADLLVTGQLRLLLQQLKAWAISNRTTVLALLSETLRAFLPRSTTVGNVRSAPWWNAGFVEAHRAAFSHCEQRFSLLPPRPSFQERLGTVEALRRQIAACVEAPHILCERRYPYLDRNLVEFLLAIPPDQLQRPGKRRSLMRRALANIVPEEVLNRKRKAFIARQPLVDVMSHWSAYRELTEHSILVTQGITDRGGLIRALEQARAGTIVSLPLLAHAVVLEKWLRHIRPYAFVSSLPGGSPVQAPPCREGNAHSISAESTFL
jgi:asparagine synthase (glutamine-hydrolysing)